MKLRKWLATALECFVAAWLLISISASAALAQNGLPELKAAVAPIPPFVMQQNGQLTGFSIDLWNAIARRANLKTDYQVLPDAAALLPAALRKMVRRPVAPAASPMCDRRYCAVGLLLALAGLLLGVSFNRSASAQQATPSLTSTMTTQDLAKSVHNPFEDFVKVPLEVDTNFRIGPRHNVGENVNLQPVFPFHLTRNWDLIARPNFTITYLPSPHEQFGLEDLQTSIFLTPSWTSEWLWGIGPIFEFPTATGKQLGTGRWSAGPTGALIYSNGPWFNGILAYHLMSFAGDRGRGSVSLTYLEPQISYNFESGWYVDTDPAMTFDWTADTANAWTLPVGIDGGKAFNLASHAMSLQVGSYYFVKRPEGSEQWMIRVSATLLFPTGR